MKGKSSCKLNWYGEDVKKAIDGTIEQKLDILGPVLVEKVRDKISQRGTGREYKIFGKIHIASAPGQPPVIMTGDLHGSIGHEVQKALFLINLLIGSWSDHAVAMEFGKDATEARPWLGVTLKENTAMIEKFLQTGWFV